MGCEDYGSPIVFERTYDVEPEDIDGVGHVNNIVYVRWVQAVATEHWLSTADPKWIDSTVWVVLRHEIDYENAAGPGDTVRVRTWVGAWRGVRTERHTEILDAASGDRLVRATTVWCPLDAATGRPRRIKDVMWVPFFEESSSE